MKMELAALLVVAVCVFAAVLLAGPLQKACIITSRDTVTSLNGGCEDPSVPVQLENGQFRPGPLFATPEPPAPPAYDLDAAKAHFAARCDMPTTVFDLVCESVRIERMAGEGYSLRVPTRLGGRRYDDAVAICRLLALAHFDQGRDLGYVDITVLKRDGRPTFLGSPPVHCSVMSR
jgi:hypothetical protein